MKASAEFSLRGDPLEFLFSDDASAASVLMIRQLHGLVTVFDGHSTGIRPYAKILLERATSLVARTDTMLSPLIHGLESSGTGCEPTALLVRPRGEAVIMPIASAEATVRLHNPQPVLRHHA